MISDSLPAPAAKPMGRIWLIIAAACLVPAVLDALQTYMQGVLLDDRPASWGSIAFSGGEWIFLGALTPIVYYLARRFPLRRRTLARTLAVHFAGSLVLCAGWAGAGIAMRVAFGLMRRGSPVGPQLASWMLTTLPYSVFMYFTVLGCVYAFMYFVEAREREAQAARLAAQLAESRLGALRMQLNPHFLFNSLNAIAVLVRDDRTQAASRMLELLGDVLHSVLRADARHEIPLDEELQFLTRYLAIEQVRFSDRLTVRWTVDDRVRSALVPGFILQPLVENALRHGIAKRSDAGSIEIGAGLAGDALVLTVRDDGPGLGPTSGDDGVGLRNARERLATLYGSAAALTLESPASGGVVATVRMPHRESAHA